MTLIFGHSMSADESSIESGISRNSIAFFSKQTLNLKNVFSFFRVKFITKKRRGERARENNTVSSDIVWESML